MPLWVPQVLLALAILLTAASGTWLLINLRSVARLFRSTGEIVPGPGRRLASKGTVVAMLIAFNVGWIGSIAIWSWVMTGEANQVVAAEP